MSLKLRIQYKAQGRSEHIVLTEDAYVIGTFTGLSQEEGAFYPIQIDVNAAPAARPIEFELKQRRPGVWVLKVNIDDAFNPYLATWTDPETKEKSPPKQLKRGKSVGLEVGTTWTRQNLVFELIDEPLDIEDFAKDIEWMEPVLELETKLHRKLVDWLTDLRARENKVLDPEKDKDKIRAQLIDVLSQEIPKCSEKVIAATVKLAVKRGLTRFISSTDKRKGSEPSENVAPIFSIVRMRKLGGNILRNIGVSGIVDPKHKILEDIRLFEAGYVAAFKKYESTLGLSESMDVAQVYLTGTIEDRVHKLGPLTELMELDAVNDIMVINYKEIYLDRLGRVERYPFRFSNDKELKDIISRILRGSSRSLDQQNPIVDVRLGDGSRVHAAQEPVVLPLRQVDKSRPNASTSLTIRKFPEDPLTFEQLVNGGSLTPQMKIFLSDCVRLRKNIIVSGGTGSGKTTLLNCLSSFCHDRHRIVTIEDTAELRIQKPHVVTMETVKGTADSLVEYDIAELVRSALRMRPDRIFVGECRGSEALDMLQAMNTGHSGSMTTAHANSPTEMLLRLENMVMSSPGAPPLKAIRNLVASAVDIIIQATRFDMVGEGNPRRVTSIAQIVGMDETGEDIVLEPVFEYVGHPEENGFHAQTGYLPTFWRHLELFKPETAEV